ncbi:MAG: bifunctional glutamate N-acetyltransferase/amino-acid acetyltransferase ArgJ [Phycicoccus sp.]|nr:bifunctional glutamate N-acetyltransferase/amino-acid acetyltransferase ArgJ [Phycicoccus sp.]NMM35084.1 bifunctional glutamate N-acetyltransferase/amino-acid acetyltransferase ArgJ [Phycicoccus sp.]
MLQPSEDSWPQGFRIHTGHAGLQDDDRDDVAILVSTVPAISAAVFTRSRFAGASVELSREAARSRIARGVVVLARNANVATGAAGLADAVEIRDRVASIIGIPVEELLIASTGVIGRRYPMAAVRKHLDSLQWPFEESDFAAAALAIMTTDTRLKLHTARVGEARIVGIAKGVGMIEPDMATMLAFVCTDAAMDPEQLDATFRAVVDRTFNSVSIDSDTSTSDTAAIFANGLAGAVDPVAFEDALSQVCLALVRDIASDGEGAGRLIVVDVDGARDGAQAKRVGKSIVNSPLVKTMVHGSDPNWGRVTMAIGKCQDDLDIDPERVRIAFGGIEVYPDEAGGAALEAVESHLRLDEVRIGVDLGIADGTWTVYGCDLTEDYVRLNSSYTT